MLDFSDRNRRTLVRAGVPHADLLEVGYSPGLTRIRPVAQVDKDIDVLFYGSTNERRARILTALQEKGLKVANLFGVYGEERDAMIARAKVVLNLHYYRASIFEAVRVSYLLANRVCVVSEGEPGDPDAARFAGGLAMVPYDALVAACVALAADPERRASLAEAGFARMLASRQADLLRARFFPDAPEPPRCRLPRPRQRPRRWPCARRRATTRPGRPITCPPDMPSEPSPSRPPTVRSDPRAPCPRIRGLPGAALRPGKDHRYRLRVGRGSALPRRPVPDHLRRRRVAGCLGGAEPAAGPVRRARP